MPTPLIDSILAQAPQRGTVERICVRPGKARPCREVERWDLSAPSMDYGRSTKRAVTLIQAEHLPVIASLLGTSAWDFLQLRRNVLVSGINLRALMGWHFRVGTAILHGTVEADPCEQMETALGAGAIHAMVGHGGICAAIVSPGTFAIGDRVELLGQTP